jgi:hypothetical protein
MYRTIEDDIARARAAATPEGCWPWQGNINDQGYGRRRVGPAPGVLWRAHILAYVTMVGPVPDGHELDHTCHTTHRDTCNGGPRCPHRRCVNPAHLEPVTGQENYERSNASRLRDKSRCDHGHPFTSENTYRHKGKGGRIYRRCRTCILASNRRSVQRHAG